MGMFVNPDNSAFQVALNSEIYVDKTGIIRLYCLPFKFKIQGGIYELFRRIQKMV